MNGLRFSRVLSPHVQQRMSIFDDATIFFYNPATSVVFSAGFFKLMNSFSNLSCFLCPSLKARPCSISNLSSFPTAITFHSNSRIIEEL